MRDFRALSLSVIALLAMLACGQAQVLIDFETAGAYAANFRSITAPPFTQTSNGAANDFVNFTTMNSAGETLYDTTPADTTLATQSLFSTTGTLTISGSFSATSANSSIAFLLVDPNNVNNNVMGIVNLDQTAPQELFRIFYDNTFSTAGATNALGTQLASDAGITTGLANPFNVSLTYDASTSALSLIAGSTTYTQTLSGVSAINWANTLVAVRLNNTGGAGSSMTFDNFSIAVPEPGTIALTTAGLVGAAGLARRKRKMRS